jgi:HEPN domain-containing protein
MISQETLAQANTELAHAENARATGFEGRARVSARRAAGLTARSYLGNRGIPVESTSAYDVLQLLRDQPESSDEIRQVIDHLLMRVDKDFQIPAQVDLIAETRWLIQILSEG